MDNNKKNNNRRGSHKGPMQGKSASQKRGAGKPVSQKERKSNRQKQQPISGFTTLSQVAGVPLLKPYHSNLPVPPQKTVTEPELTCPVCGEKIGLIAECFLNPSGEYVHFDCVLKELKEMENLMENQTISYIGSGAFGVCEKDENGKYTIVKKIDYENSERFSNMKSYVESLKN